MFSQAPVWPVWSQSSFCMVGRLKTLWEWLCRMLMCCWLWPVFSATVFFCLVHSYIFLFLFIICHAKTLIFSDTKGCQNTRYLNWQHHVVVIGASTKQAGDQRLWTGETLPCSSSSPSSSFSEAYWSTHSLFYVKQLPCFKPEVTAFQRQANVLLYCCQTVISCTLALFFQMALLDVSGAALAWLQCKRDLI